MNSAPALANNDLENVSKRGSARRSSAKPACGRCSRQPPRWRLQRISAGSTTTRRTAEPEVVNGRDVGVRSLRRVKQQRRPAGMLWRRCAACEQAQLRREGAHAAAARRTARPRLTTRDPSTPHPFAYPLPGGGSKPNAQGSTVVRRTVVPARMPSRVPSPCAASTPRFAVTTYGLPGARRRRAGFARARLLR